MLDLIDNQIPDPREDRSNPKYLMENLEGWVGIWEGVVRSEEMPEDRELADSKYSKQSCF